MLPYAPVSMRRDDREIKAVDWVDCQRVSRMAIALSSSDGPDTPPSRHMIAT